MRATGTVESIEPAGYDDLFIMVIIPDNPEHKYEALVTELEKADIEKLTPGQRVAYEVVDEPDGEWTFRLLEGEQQEVTPRG